MRVGIGYDARAFDSLRPLVLGGCKIPGAWGLRGVADDADVLLRALADAMLGAAGLGGLMDHFPVDEPPWRGTPSAVLLAEVRAKVRVRGLEAANVDLTLVAARPDLGPHREAMRARVADLLGVERSRVNVKTTVGPGAGAPGAEAGSAALAVVLLADAEGARGRES